MATKRSASLNRYLNNQSDVVNARAALAADLKSYNQAKFYFENLSPSSKDFSAALDNWNLAKARAESLQQAESSIPGLLEQIQVQATKFSLNKKANVDREFDSIIKAFQAFYTAKVHIKARVLGVILIDDLKKEVNKLSFELTQLEQILKELDHLFEDRQKTYTNEINSLAENSVNGIVLYKESDVNQIYRSILEDEASRCQSITERILSTLNKRLFDFHAFDEVDIRSVAKLISENALEEFLDQPELQISAARKFQQIYPTIDQQEAQIKTAFAKSEPFIRFSQQQINLGWDNLTEKRQSLVGIHGGSASADSAVANLLPIIRKTRNLS